MPIYTYIKQDNSPKRKAIYYFSYISLTIGSFLMFWSFYPIISFEIYSRLFIQNKIQTPVPKSVAITSLDKANTVLGGFDVYSNNLRDFTNASLWFPDSHPSDSTRKLSIKEYSLIIPKLNIDEAKVVVGGEDLAKSLVQFLPQSLPGEYGNVVIFGHSTLPQLFNPKDYKTIFTYLASMDKGNKIYAKVDNVAYEYEVYDMFVINPDEISVLEQKNDASYLTLITCVPPGTYWKRLVVRAKLTKLPGNL